MRAWQPVTAAGDCPRYIRTAPQLRPVPRYRVGASAYFHRVCFRNWRGNWQWPTLCTYAGSLTFPDSRLSCEAIPGGKFLRAVRFRRYFLVLPRRFQRRYRRESIRNRRFLRQLPWEPSNCVFPQHRPTLSAAEIDASFYKERRRLQTAFPRRGLRNISVRRTVLKNSLHLIRRVTDNRVVRRKSELKHCAGERYGTGSRQGWRRQAPIQSM